MTTLSLKITFDSCSNPLQWDYQCTHFMHKETEAHCVGHYLGSTATKWQSLAVDEEAGPGVHSGARAASVIE